MEVSGLKSVQLHAGQQAAVNRYDDSLGGEAEGIETLTDLSACCCWNK